MRRRFRHRVVGWPSMRRDREIRVADSHLDRKIGGGDRNHIQNCHRETLLTQLMFSIGLVAYLLWNIIAVAWIKGHYNSNTFVEDVNPFAVAQHDIIVPARMLG